MKAQKKKKKIQQTSNKIITQAYQSRCSSWKTWKPSGKARIAWDFSTLLPQARWIREHDAIRNQISSDFDKRRLRFLNQKTQ